MQTYIHITIGPPTPILKFLAIDRNDRTLIIFSYVAVPMFYPAWA